MAGPIRRWLAQQFPIGARVIGAVRDVVASVGEVAHRVLVGAAEARPVDQTVEARLGLPALALVRKAVASFVGAVTGGWLGSILPFDISFLNAEITEVLVAALVGAYFAWRFPNAPRSTTTEMRPTK